MSAFSIERMYDPMDRSPEAFRQHLHTQMARPRTLVPAEGSGAYDTAQNRRLALEFHDAGQRTETYPFYDFAEVASLTLAESLVQMQRAGAVDADVFMDGLRELPDCDEMFAYFDTESGRAYRQVYRDVLEGILGGDNQQQGSLPPAPAAIEAQSAEAPTRADEFDEYIARSMTYARIIIPEPAGELSDNTQSRRTYTLVVQKNPDADVEKYPVADSLVLSALTQAEMLAKYNAAPTLQEYWDGLQKDPDFKELISMFERPANQDLKKVFLTHLQAFLPNPGTSVRRSVERRRHDDRSAWIRFGAVATASILVGSTLALGLKVITSEDAPQPQPSAITVDEEGR